uniref:Uncharacterized protein LOC114328927 n=1 Tax=Diabrotica virgifera virgifera TaxID=50390 RepID=A0A6P7FCL4_DIAVI
MGDLSEETRMEAAGAADHIEHTDKGAVETADHAEERGIEADQLETSLEKLSLGTKKLSGAQKRRLKKAEKIAAGTWVKENPHKTKGQKGKSDQTTGVKRTRSDNSTPTKNPEAKRPKGITKQAANNATRSGNTQTGTVASAKEVRGSKTQTGTYGEVTDKLRMAVVDRRHPEVKLNQEQAELVRTKLEEAVDKAPGGSQNPLQFLRTTFSAGILWIHCANEPTKSWLEGTVRELRDLWESADLKLIESKDLRRPIVLVHVPETGISEKVFRSRLGKQNAGLNTTDWTLKSQKVEGQGEILAYSIDKVSFRALKQTQLKAFYRMGRVAFKIVRETDGDDKGESDPSQPSTQ